MVGVAGRSKGCNTCKKRKIACSLQRPQCAQCIRSNRLCTGYQRETVFIVNSDYAATLIKSRKACTAQTRTQQGPNGHAELGTRANYAASVSAWEKVKSVKADATLPSKLCSVPAYRQQLLDIFIRGHVPLDQLGPRQEKIWLQDLADLPEKPPVLTSAILCVSTARIAKKQGDEALSYQSLALYTEGLWRLQKALWDPDQMFSDTTLAACFLLSIYELFECPGEDRFGYIKHCDGCARLIQLRGPEAHREGFAHKMFTAARMPAILQQLERHHPTFLTYDEWLEVPWQYHPKNVVDRLYDNIAQAPGIFSQTDAFSVMAPVDILSTALRIIGQCWEMDADLEDLYFALESSVPGPLYWPKLSTLPNAADDEINGKVFPVAYEFINLRIALTLMLYWSTLNMMYNGLVLLYGVLQQIPVSRQEVLEWKEVHPLLLKGIAACGENCACEGTGCKLLFDMSKLRPLGSKADFLTPGRNVCQSVEYCLQPQMLDLGPSEKYNGERTYFEVQKSGYHT